MLFLAAGHAQAAGIGLRRFQCFEVKRHAFASRSVSIVDALSSGTVSIERPDRLCTPADVKDSDPGALADMGFLTGYPAAHDFPPLVRQAVVNEFGTAVLDILPPDRLLVPTGKAPAAPPAGLDHFECYRLRLAEAFTPVTGIKVDDPYGTATVTLRRPIRLCVPADKNNESPGAETHRTGLLCYQTRSKVPFPDFEVALQNQFGPQHELLIRRMELCVPSTWGPFTPTTTVTTSTTSTSHTITSSSTSTSRPGATSTSTTSSVTMTFGTTVTSTSKPGGGSTTTSSTATTIPGGGSTTTTVPAGGSTTTTVPGGGSTTTTVPGGSSSTTSTVPGATTTTTSSTTSTTLPVACTTAADCPQTACLTAACADNVCTYSAIVDCPLCIPGPETCGNGRDDDCDNLVDCHDPDCAGAPGCATQEICGDCIDNDGDGLVDFEDPDCCAETLALDVHLLRLRIQPSRRNPDRVRLRGVWAPTAPAGFDPMKQDTSIQIRDQHGELFCTTIAAMHWMPMHGSIAFWDRQGAFSGGLTDGRFTVRRTKRVDFRTHGPAPGLGAASAGTARVTVRVGGRCSQSTGTLRGKGNALVVRPSGR